MYFRRFLLAILMPVVFVFGQEKASVSFQTDFLSVFNRAADKVVSLADAIPEESYDWRPAEGVRSVKESLAHITGANYFFSSMFGAAIPEGINPREMEKVMQTKQQAMTELKKSIEHARTAVENLNADKLTNEIDLFGNKATIRTAVLFLGDHMAEHLGQLIAYARSNNVTPPWSQKNN